MPLPVPIPPSPDASAALLAAFEERDIAWHPRRWCGLDPAARVAVLGDGAELPYDLFLGVPVHRVPEVVAAVGAERRRLDPGRPAHPRDLVRRTCTRWATSPASEPRRRASSRRARRRSSADGIVAHVAGRPDRRHYDGRGICYLEFGHDQVAEVDVTFLSGQAPRGCSKARRRLLVADKAEFGTSRIRRWFSRTWP